MTSLKTGIDPDDKNINIPKGAFKPKFNNFWIQEQDVTINAVTEVLDASKWIKVSYREGYEEGQEYSEEDIQNFFAAEHPESIISKLEKEYPKKSFILNTEKYKEFNTWNTLSKEEIKKLYDIVQPDWEKHLRTKAEDIDAEAVMRSNIIKTAIKKLLKRLEGITSEDKRTEITLTFIAALSDKLNTFGFKATSASLTFSILLILTSSPFAQNSEASTAVQSILSTSMLNKELKDEFNHLLNQDLDLDDDDLEVIKGFADLAKVSLDTPTSKTSPFDLTISSKSNWENEYWLDLSDDFTSSVNSMPTRIDTWEALSFVRTWAERNELGRKLATNSTSAWEENQLLINKRKNLKDDLLWSSIKDQFDGIAEWLKEALTLLNQERWTLWSLDSSDINLGVKIIWMISIDEDFSPGKFLLFSNIYNLMMSNVPENLEEDSWIDPDSYVKIVYSTYILTNMLYNNEYTKDNIDNFEWLESNPVNTINEAIAFITWWKDTVVLNAHSRNDNYAWHKHIRVVLNSPEAKKEFATTLAKMFYSGENGLSVESISNIWERAYKVPWMDKMLHLDDDVKAVWLNPESSSSDRKTLTKWIWDELKWIHPNSSKSMTKNKRIEALAAVFLHELDFKVLGVNEPIDFLKEPIAESFDHQLEVADLKLQKTYDNLQMLSEGIYNIWELLELYNQAKHSNSSIDVDFVKNFEWEVLISLIETLARVSTSKYLTLPVAAYVNGSTSEIPWEETASVEELAKYSNYARSVLIMQDHVLTQSTRLLKDLHKIRQDSKEYVAPEYKKDPKLDLGGLKIEGSKEEWFSVMDKEKQIITNPEIGGTIVASSWTREFGDVTAIVWASLDLNDMNVNLEAAAWSLVRLNQKIVEVNAATLEYRDSSFNMGFGHTELIDGNKLERLIAYARRGSQVAVWEWREIRTSRVQMWGKFGHYQLKEDSIFDMIYAIWKFDHLFKKEGLGTIIENYEEELYDETGRRIRKWTREYELYAKWGTALAFTLGWATFIKTNSWITYSAKVQWTLKWIKIDWESLDLSVIWDAVQEVVWTVNMPWSNPSSGTLVKASLDSSVSTDWKPTNDLSLLMNVTENINVWWTISTHESPSLNAAYKKDGKKAYIKASEDKTEVWVEVDLSWQWESARDEFNIEPDELKAFKRWSLDINDVLDLIKKAAQEKLLSNKLWKKLKRDEYIEMWEWVYVETNEDWSIKNIIFDIDGLNDWTAISAILSNIIVNGGSDLIKIPFEELKDAPTNSNSYVWVNSWSQPSSVALIVKWQAENKDSVNISYFKWISGVSSNVATKWWQRYFDGYRKAVYAWFDWDFWNDFAWILEAIISRPQNWNFVRFVKGFEDKAHIKSEDVLAAYQCIDDFESKDANEVDSYIDSEVWSLEALCSASINTSNISRNHSVAAGWLSAIEVQIKGATGVSFNTPLPEGLNFDISPVAWKEWFFTVILDAVNYFPEENYAKTIPLSITNGTQTITYNYRIIVTEVNRAPNTPDTVLIDVMNDNISGKFNLTDLDGDNVRFTYFESNNADFNDRVTYSFNTDWTYNIELSNYSKLEGPITVKGKAIDEHGKEIEFDAIVINSVDTMPWVSSVEVLERSSTWMAKMKIKVDYDNTLVKIAWMPDKEYPAWEHEVLVPIQDREQGQVLIPLSSKRPDAPRTISTTASATLDYAPSLRIIDWCSTSYIQWETAQFTLAVENAVWTDITWEYGIRFLDWTGIALWTIWANQSEFTINQLMDDEPGEIVYSYYFKETLTEEQKAAWLVEDEDVIDLTCNIEAAEITPDVPTTVKFTQESNDGFNYIMWNFEVEFDNTLWALRVVDENWVLIKSIPEGWTHPHKFDLTEKPYGRDENGNLRVEKYYYLTWEQKLEELTDEEKELQTFNFKYERFEAPEILEITKDTLPWNIYHRTLKFDIKTKGKACKLRTFVTSATWEDPEIPDVDNFEGWEHIVQIPNMVWSYSIVVLCDINTDAWEFVTTTNQQLGTYNLIQTISPLVEDITETDSDSALVQVTNQSSTLDAVLVTNWEPWETIAANETKSIRLENLAMWPNDFSFKMRYWVNIPGWWEWHVDSLATLRSINRIEPSDVKCNYPNETYEDSVELSCLSEYPIVWITLNWEEVEVAWNLTTETLNIDTIWEEGSTITWTVVIKDSRNVNHIIQYSILKKAKVDLKESITFTAPSELLTRTAFKKDCAFPVKWIVKANWVKVLDYNNPGELVDCVFPAPADEYKGKLAPYTLTFEVDSEDPNAWKYSDQETTIEFSVAVPEDLDQTLVLPDDLSTYLSGHTVSVENNNPSEVFADYYDEAWNLINSVKLWETKDETPKDFTVPLPRIGTHRFKIRTFEIDLTPNQNGEDELTPVQVKSSEFISFERLEVDINFSATIDSIQFIRWDSETTIYPTHNAYVQIWENRIEAVFNEEIGKYEIKVPVIPKTTWEGEDKKIVEWNQTYSYVVRSIPNAEENQETERVTTVSFVAENLYSDFTVEDSASVEQGQEATFDVFSNRAANAVFTISWTKLDGSTFEKQFGCEISAKQTKACALPNDVTSIPGTHTVNVVVTETGLDPKSYEETVSLEVTQPSLTWSVSHDWYNRWDFSVILNDLGFNVKVTTEDGNEIIVENPQTGWVAIPIKSKWGWSNSYTLVISSTEEWDTRTKTLTFPSKGLLETSLTLPSDDVSTYEWVNAVFPATSANKAILWVEEENTSRTKLCDLTAWEQNWSCTLSYLTATPWNDKTINLVLEEEDGVETKHTLTLDVNAKTTPSLSVFQFDNYAVTWTNSSWSIAFNVNWTLVVGWESYTMLAGVPQTVTINNIVDWINEEAYEFTPDQSVSIKNEKKTGKISITWVALWTWSVSCDENEIYAWDFTSCEVSFDKIWDVYLTDRWANTNTAVVTNASLNNDTTSLSIQGAVAWNYQKDVYVKQSLINQFVKVWEINIKVLANSEITPAFGGWEICPEYTKNNTINCSISTNTKWTIEIFEEGDLSIPLRSFSTNWNTNESFTIDWFTTPDDWQTLTRNFIAKFTPIDVEWDGITLSSTEAVTTSFSTERYKLGKLTSDCPENDILLGEPLQCEIFTRNEIVLKFVPEGETYETGILIWTVASWTSMQSLDTSVLWPIKGTFVGKETNKAAWMVNASWGVDTEIIKHTPTWTLTFANSPLPTQATWSYTSNVSWVLELNNQTFNITANQANSIILTWLTANTLHNLEGKFTPTDTSKYEITNPEVSFETAAEGIVSASCSNVTVLESSSCEINSTYAWTAKFVDSEWNETNLWAVIAWKTNVSIPTTKPWTLTWTIIVTEAVSRLERPTPVSINVAKKEFSYELTWEPDNGLTTANSVSFEFTPTADCNLTFDNKNEGKVSAWTTKTITVNTTTAQDYDLAWSCALDEDDAYANYSATLVSWNVEFTKANVWALTMSWTLNDVYVWADQGVNLVSPNGWDIYVLPEWVTSIEGLTKYWTSTPGDNFEVEFNTSSTWRIAWRFAVYDPILKQVFYSNPFDFEVLAPVAPPFALWAGSNTATTNTSMSLDVSVSKPWTISVNNQTFRVDSSTTKIELTNIPVWNTPLTATYTPDAAADKSVDTTPQTSSVARNVLLEATVSTTCPTTVIAGEDLTCTVKVTERALNATFTRSGQPDKEWAIPVWDNNEIKIPTSLADAGGTISWILTYVDELTWDTTTQSVSASAEMPSSAELSIAFPGWSTYVDASLVNPKATVTTDKDVEWCSVNGDSVSDIPSSWSLQIALDMTDPWIKKSIEIECKDSVTKELARKSVEYLPAYPAWVMFSLNWQASSSIDLTTTETSVNLWFASANTWILFVKRWSWAFENKWAISSWDLKTLSFDNLDWETTIEAYVISENEWFADLKSSTISWTITKQEAYSDLQTVWTPDFNKWAGQLTATISYNWPDITNDTEIIAKNSWSTTVLNTSVTDNWDKTVTILVDGVNSNRASKYDVDIIIWWAEVKITNK